LSALVRQMEAAAAAGDEYGLFELDQQFHVTLFHWAEMPSLVPVLTRCSLYNHRNKIALDVAPRSLMETAQRHWRIVAALESGQLAEAERVLRHHIESVVGGTKRRVAVPRSPRLAALWQRVQAEDAGLPDITRLPPAEGRRQFDGINARWNQIDAGQYRIDAFTIPAPPRTGRATGEGIGALRIEALPSGRVAKGKQRKAGTILFLHGGGWVFGSVQTHRGAMARLAELTGCVVVGVDYGLAPEAPFPHGLNDCVWAWRWLRSHADSAGAPWFIGGIRPVPTSRWRPCSNCVTPASPCPTRRCCSTASTAPTIRRLRIAAAATAASACRAPRWPGTERTTWPAADHTDDPRVRAPTYMAYRRSW
jgi:hypothetical protein